MEQQTPPQVPNEPQDELPPQPVGEYLKQVEPLQKHKKERSVSFFVGLAVLLMVLGAGGFMYMKNRSDVETKKNEPVAEVAQQPKVAINSETKRYSSSQFSLDFDYPSDWEVKEEQTEGILTATSPNVSIPASGGGVVTGRIVLTVMGKNQKLPEFDKGNSTAVIDSEKVAYLKPSSAQRGQTYISFLNYANSDSSGLIDGVYITGDFGYQVEQAIPKVDIQKIDPIIKLTFLACDGTCAKPIGITKEAWVAPEFGGALKKILQSFTIN